MTTIKMSNGKVNLVFNVFSNGNAIFVTNGKLIFIEDFAEKYIALTENGYEYEEV